MIGIFFSDLLLLKKERDIEKREACKQLGITLIEVQQNIIVCSFLNLFVSGTILVGPTARKSCCNYQTIPSRLFFASLTFLIENRFTY